MSNDISETNMIIFVALSLEFDHIAMVCMNGNGISMPADKGQILLDNLADALMWKLFPERADGEVLHDSNKCRL